MTTTLITLEQCTNTNTLDSQLRTATGEGYNTDWKFALYFDKSFDFDAVTDSEYCDINYGYYNAKIGTFALMDFNEVMATNKDNIDFIMIEVGADGVEQSPIMVNMDEVSEKFEKFYA